MKRLLLTLVSLVTTLCVYSQHLAGGEYASYSVCVDGTVMAWGRNDVDQLGDGTNIDRPLPVQVVGLTGITSVVAGRFQVYALKSDGTVWAWGDNSIGGLGDNTTVNRSTPVQVSGLTDVKMLAAGWGYGLALKKDGTVWGWGADTEGYLGDGISGHNDSTPVQTNISDVKYICSGLSTSMALKNDGSVWIWGYGSMGNGIPISNYIEPQKIDTLNNIISIAAGFGHSLALDENGGLWAWGDNEYGELGDGTLDYHYKPERSAILTGATKLLCATSAFHSIALADDSTAWIWGYNASGELGNNTVLDNGIPTKINDAGIIEMAIGAFFTLELKRGRTLVAWGQNDYHQLADGTASDQRQPVTVMDVCPVMVGVEEPSAQHRFWCYPNPSQGTFKIVLNESAVEATIGIYDVMGRNVYTDAFTGLEKTLNCTLKEGIYFLRISDKEHLMIEKIVIE